LNFYFFNPKVIISFELGSCKYSETESQIS